MLGELGEALSYGFSANEDDIPEVGQPLSDAFDRSGRFKHRTNMDEPGQPLRRTNMKG
jgi:hypothetical protein